MARSDTNLRRWRAGMWPSAPPPRPALGFPGPVGLWDGGALLSYDQAEHQGFLHDARLRHPPPGAYEQQWEANARRCERWQREEDLGRGEVYLDLVALDLKDIDAVLDFVSTWGVLDIRALDAPRPSRQWYGVATEPATPFRVLRHYPGFSDDRRRSRDSSLRSGVLATAQEQRAAAPNWVVAETLEEFRWGARAIHDLHAAWLALSEPADPRQVNWANPRMPGRGDDLGRAQSEVANFFEETMRYALEGFSPRIWLVDDASERMRYGSLATPEPSEVTLFEVLAIELFSHVAENAPYKLCANPTCRRTFVRQNGGAVYRQSRTRGVLYCSRVCANAVAQRRYRQRRAAARPAS